MERIILKEGTMKILRYAVLAVLMALICVTPAMAKQKFSTGSLKGCYGFVFNGTLIQNAQGVPAVAEGLVCGDGKGKITKLLRVLNIGGEISRQTATGSYSVESDGTGEAKFDVKTGGVPSSKEKFDFTLADKSKRIQFILSDFKGPDGKDLGIRVVVSGNAIKQ